MTDTAQAPDSEQTKKLMASTSSPPTEDEVAGIMASRIADQVDFELAQTMMKSTPNGCLCAELDAGQVCIVCRARSQAERHCRKCSVGLFEGDETLRRKCTECYYNENPNAP